MKNIQIILKNRVIKLKDNDTSEINKYIEDISEIMKSPDITILSLSTCSILLRPTEIISIIVTEGNNNEDEEVVYEEI